MDHKTLGIFGEQLAKEYLTDHAYKIRSSNFRFKKWEVDIIAETEKTFVFVEVKTRQNDYLGEPWRAVTKIKQKQIIRVAHEYLIQNNIEKETRFDVVSILYNPDTHLKKIEHIKDAFYPML
jgi:putative endonuclease